LLIKVSLVDYVEVIRVNVTLIYYYYYYLFEIVFVYTIFQLFQNKFDSLGIVYLFYF